MECTLMLTDYSYNLSTDLSDNDDKKKRKSIYIQNDLKTESNMKRLLISRLYPNCLK